MCRQAAHASLVPHSLITRRRVAKSNAKMTSGNTYHFVNMLQSQPSTFVPIQGHAAEQRIGGRV